MVRERCRRTVTSPNSRKSHYPSTTPSQTRAQLLIVAGQSIDQTPSSPIHYTLLISLLRAEEDPIVRQPILGRFRRSRIARTCTRSRVDGSSSERE